MLAQPFAWPDVTTLVMWSLAKATFRLPHNEQSETEVLLEKYSLTHVGKYSQQGTVMGERRSREVAPDTCKTAKFTGRPEDMEQVKRTKMREKLIQQVIFQITLDPRNRVSNSSGSLLPYLLKTDPSLSNSYHVPGAIGTLQMVVAFGQHHLLITSDL
ncbi:hypothetical protein llap_6526 [Limosa lapponica baueri]|uniref:Uncharacterized protein n=1 Tax=Limosa lapponica baueri TaxID=1758121 RepID=A0A2I0UAU2_LIMLA|nr:hypothetical protein llap_6526 [Limosa lapponica baueri]